MKLRFLINQAEAFRRGVDAPKSVVMVDVKPAELNEAERTLIADRLDGINVCKLALKDGKRVRQRMLVMALDATLKSLLAAIKLDEQELLSKRGAP